MQAGDVLDDREPQPRAAERAGMRFVRAVKALEDARKMFLRNPDAEIAHGNFRVVLRFFQRNFNGRTSGIFYRVADEIDDRLLDESRIAVEFNGIVFGDFERRSRGFRTRQTGIHGVFERGIETKRERFALAGNLLPLNRGKAEHIVHKRVQSLRLRRKNSEKFFAQRGIVERSGFERIDGAENSRERRFDFVRNVGDEIAAERFQPPQIRQIGDGDEEPPMPVVFKRSAFGEKRARRSALDFERDFRFDGNAVAKRFVREREQFRRAAASEIEFCRAGFEPENFARGAVEIKRIAVFGKKQHGFGKRGENAFPRVALSGDAVELRFQLLFHPRNGNRKLAHDAFFRHGNAFPQIAARNALRAFLQLHERTAHANQNVKRNRERDKHAERKRENVVALGARDNRFDFAVANCETQNEFRASVNIHGHRAVNHALVFRRAETGADARRSRERAGNFLARGVIFERVFVRRGIDDDRSVGTHKRYAQNFFGKIHAVIRDCGEISGHEHRANHIGKRFRLGHDVALFCGNVGFLEFFRAEKKRSRGNKHQQPEQQRERKKNFISGFHDVFFLIPHS